MYWGFLVLSLILQAYVISSTYGYKTRPIKQLQANDSKTNDEDKVDERSEIVELRKKITIEKDNLEKIH